VFYNYADSDSLQNSLGESAPPMVAGQKSQNKKFARHNATSIYKLYKLCRHQYIIAVFIEVGIIGITKCGTGLLFLITMC